MEVWLVDASKSVQEVVQSAIIVNLSKEELWRWFEETPPRAVIVLADRKRETFSHGADAVAFLTLTTREKAVLNLVARGWSNKQIAHHLAISEKTVGFHVGNILRKIGASSRIEAAAKFIRWEEAQRSLLGQGLALPT